MMYLRHDPSEFIGPVVVAVLKPDSITEQARITGIRELASKALKGVVKAPYTREQQLAIAILEYFNNQGY